MAYMGFKKLESKLSGKVSNPGAVAASIGRKKYGAKAFNKAAAEGKSMKGYSHLPKGVAQTPKGDIGAHRAAEAKELGTFKNVPDMEASGHFSDAEPATKIDSFYETFASKERSHYA